MAKKRQREEESSKGGPSPGRRAVKLRGAKAFRSRLMLATLAKRRVVISDIRENEEAPGVGADEACFIRLLDKLTSGSKIEINETGTTLRYSPGYLAGGAVEHDCSRTARGVGWFLEGVLPLAPFCSSGLELTLLGVTSGGASWRSVDAMRRAAVEAIMKDTFGVSIELSLERRQAAGKSPEEGPGRATLRCSPVRTLTTVDRLSEGLAKNVRGLAYSTRVSPALVNRCVAAARSLLNQLVADVRVSIDAAPRRRCADVPGFGIVLVAETTEGAKIAVDLDAAWVLDEHNDPETLGRKAALALCSELAKAAVCDLPSLPLFLTLMALGPDHVNRAKLPGPLSPPAVDRLDLIHAFLGVSFKLDPLDPDTPDSPIRAVCRGANYANLAKPVT